MGDFIPVDFSELEKSIANAPPKARQKKDLFNREGKIQQQMLQQWWELSTTAEECDYCSHRHMVAIKPDDTKVCRRCYLACNDIKPSEERELHDDPS